MSQDGTSFPERHHLLFSNDHPRIFSRFAALFGHLLSSKIPNLSLLKNQSYHVRLALPPAEEGPVSQDGTSFPERHHLFFQLITPVFFRFGALFGHFFPKSTSRRFQPVTAEKEDPVLKNETFSLSLKGPPCMEICIQIINHQGCLFVFFKWSSCFQAHFQAQQAGSSNLSPQNNQSCHVCLALSPAEEGPVSIGK